MFANNALRRLWPYARPYARGLGFSLVMGLGMMGAGLTIPPLTGAIVDELDLGKDFGRVLRLGGLVALAGLVESIFAHLRRYSAAAASIGMERDLRNAFYLHLQRLPVSFHDGWQSGQLLSRAMTDIGTIRRFIGFGLIFLILNMTQFAAVAYLMVRRHLGLAILTAVLGVPVVMVAHRFGRRYRSIARKVQDDQGDLATVIEESATGIRILKAFGRGRDFGHTFTRQADVLHGSNMDAVRLRARFWSLMHLLPMVSLGVIVAVGGIAVIDGALTIGSLTTFIAYLYMLIWPVRSIGWILAQGEEARSGAERLMEVFDTAPAIADGAGARTADEATGNLHFDGVGFRYDGAAQETLHGIDLEIAPGETLALVGATGSGKTTLAMLVPRLYDATTGRITLDGTDLRDLTLRSLRRHIGVAFEDPILFSMSARENLLMGAPHATDDDINRALETANATFIYDLPWGLDTRVGEQGYSLSGGQRQRLALARAVLCGPQVLVLDDPLSAVDVHTEAQIEAALHNMLSGVTALLVVHRPSTLALADRVALLDGGTIAAVGTHSELMSSVPLYRDILSQEAEEVAR